MLQGESKTALRERQRVEITCFQCHEHEGGKGKEAAHQKHAVGPDAVKRQNAERQYEGDGQYRSPQESEGGFALRKG